MELTLPSFSASGLPLLILVVPVTFRTGLIIFVWQLNGIIYVSVKYLLVQVLPCLEAAGSYVLGSINWGLRLPDLSVRCNMSVR